MSGNGTLIAKLEQQVEKWESLATEARTRADQGRPGDMNPAYLYGLTEGVHRESRN